MLRSPLLLRDHLPLPNSPANGPQSLGMQLQGLSPAHFRQPASSMISSLPSRIEPPPARQSPPQIGKLQTPLRPSQLVRRNSEAEAQTRGVVNLHQHLRVSQAIRILIVAEAPMYGSWWRTKRALRELWVLRCIDACHGSSQRYCAPDPFENAALKILGGCCRCLQARGFGRTLGSGDKSHGKRRVGILHVIRIILIGSSRYRLHNAIQSIDGDLKSGKVRLYRTAIHAMSHNS